MTLLSLFAALLVALVTSQQTLILTQHTALMALYAALGLPEREKRNFFFWKNSPSFFSFFFSFPRLQHDRVSALRVKSSLYWERLDLCGGLRDKSVRVRCFALLVV